MDVYYAPKGKFTTEFGLVSWAYFDWDVKLAGDLVLSGRPIHVEFWMRRMEDGDWNRDGTKGAAVVRDVEPDAPVFEQYGTSVRAGYPINTKRVKELLDAVRDGWRKYVSRHPEVHRECVRQRTESRLRAVRGERDALQRLLDHKSQEVRLLEQIVASEDIEAAWAEANKVWPKHPWD